MLSIKRFNASLPGRMLGRGWHFSWQFKLNQQHSGDNLHKPITESVYFEYLWLFIAGLTLFYPFYVCWGKFHNHFHVIALNAHKSQSKGPGTIAAIKNKRAVRLAMLSTEFSLCLVRGMWISVWSAVPGEALHGWIVTGSVYTELTGRAKVKKVKHPWCKTSCSKCDSWVSYLSNLKEVLKLQKEHKNNI